MTTENQVESIKNQSEDAPQSDAKLILAPLAKYAVVAVIMVSIIVTTAVMLDREMGDIDEQLASLEAEIAVANSPDNADAVVADTNEVTVSDTSSISSTDADAAVVTVEATKEVNTPEVSAEATPDTSTDAAPVEVSAMDTATTSITTSSTPVAVSVDSQNVAQEENRGFAFNHSRPTFAPDMNSFKSEMHARISEHNNYLKTLDNKSLEDFKANQDEMINMMLQQIANQQEVIEEMRARNQEVYDMRAASMKHMQEVREHRLDRI